MAAVTNKLMYEVLKLIQERLSRIEETQREIKLELSAMRGHIIAIQTDIRVIYDKIATHDARFDLIERRLDLFYEPAQ